MNDELKKYDKEYLWAVLLTIQKGSDIYNVITNRYTDSDFMQLLQLLDSIRYIQVEGIGRSSRFVLTEKGDKCLTYLHKTLGKRGLYRHFMLNYSRTDCHMFYVQEIYVPDKQTIKKMQKNTFISESPTV